jgi:hypothetical protein
VTWVAVTGLRAEAEIARRAGLEAICAGGVPARTAAALERAIAGGATFLLSFGIAGGLDPSLLPGDLVVATRVRGPGGAWRVDMGWAAALARATGARLGVLAGANAAVADPAGKRVVLLGAGGAARAIGVELALAGVEHITVVNRSEPRGRELARLLSEKVNVRAEFVPWRGEYRVPEGTDVVINATSVGLYPDADARLPLDVGSLRPGMVVADVIPNPPRTRLVRDAEARGCRALDGLGMLVNQGVLGIKYWTGIDPDPRVMRRALEEVFAP